MKCVFLGNALWISDVNLHEHEVFPLLLSQNLVVTFEYYRVEPLELISFRKVNLILNLVDCAFIV